MTAITTAAHIDAQTQEELMRQAGIWIEHSTLIEDDLPARPLAAVQAEKHHLDRYTQLVADRAAARGSKCLAQIEEPAGAAPAAVAPQGEDWRKPTTYLQRFGDAIALLCHGRRPDDLVLSSWLDGSSFVLQQFAIDNGPAWAQGIGLIDAATIAADQPTEGVAHEMRADQSSAVSVPTEGHKLWAVFRQREDENDGKEFLHYALWHKDTILSAGERYVEGYFVPLTPAAPALEAPAAPAVPAGFALVPIEPTQQMLDAGRWSGAGSVSIQEEWARKEVWSRMLATVTPPPAAYADDLVALVTELVQALRKATPDNDLAGHALDYLKRNGLQESPLRAADTAPQGQTDAQCVAAWRQKMQDEREGDAVVAMAFDAGRRAAAAPQAPAAPWKDHKTARLVNDLRDCAIKYHGAGQLRERIAHIVVPLCDQLKGAQAAPAAPAEGEVLVEVIGLTGSGKSAICGEIEILCRALGLDVSWPDGDPEKNMTHAEWTAAIEAYKPRVRIVERNVPRQSNGGPAK